MLRSAETSEAYYWLDAFNTSMKMKIAISIQAHMVDILTDGSGYVKVCWDP